MQLPKEGVRSSNSPMLSKCSPPASVIALVEMVHSAHMLWPTALSILLRTSRATPKSAINSFPTKL